MTDLLTPEEIDALRSRAERAEAELEKRKSGCKCTFAQSILGDGCDACNPALALEHAQSTIADLNGQVERLRDFASDLADEGCHYGDNCPPFANTRHGTCLACRARDALGGEK